MTLRLDDLPPAMRRQVEAKVGKRATKPRRQSTGPCPGSCSCGEPFTSYGRWERHCDASGPGHRRWSVTA